MDVEINPSSTIHLAVFCDINMLNALSMFLGLLKTSRRLLNTGREQIFYLFHLALPDLNENALSR